MEWESLVEPDSNFRTLIAQPIINFTKETKIDRSSVFIGTISPFHTISGQIAKGYDTLFKGRTLQDFPDPSKPSNPVFSILATNLKNGLQVKFRKNCFFHYPIGYMPTPNIPVSIAVTASSAFPPILSPLTLKIAPNTSFISTSKNEDVEEDVDLVNQTNPSYKFEYKLGDGGIYDNLGYEDIDNVDIAFVSDAGKKHKPTDTYNSFWPSQIIPLIGMIDAQVRSLRLQEVYRKAQKGRNGVFWQIHRNQSLYDKVVKPEEHIFTAEEVDALANENTALRPPKQSVESLVNWGYTSFDNAFRNFYESSDSFTSEFILPFPGD